MFAFMSMPLDPVGNASLILQVVILFLLILGLPFFRRDNSKKNLIRHGYFTIAAVLLHTVLIFLVMIPTFASGVIALETSTLLDIVNVWLHVVMGTVAEVLGIVIVATWLRYGPSKMMCVRLRKWMLPTFVIWAISLVGGAIVHIFGMI